MVSGAEAVEFSPLSRQLFVVAKEEPSTTSQPRRTSSKVASHVPRSISGFRELRVELMIPFRSSTADCFKSCTDGCTCALSPELRTTGHGTLQLEAVAHVLHDLSVGVLCFFKQLAEQHSSFIACWCKTTKREKWFVLRQKPL